MAAARKPKIHHQRPAGAQAAAQPRRETTKASDFFSVYTNDARVFTTAWDIRITFGEIADISDRGPKVASIKELGEIRMSLPLAKKLARILADQISAYEEHLGEIAGPKD
jgi:hypothetical protein